MKNRMNLPLSMIQMVIKEQLEIEQDYYKGGIFQGGIETQCIHLVEMEILPSDLWSTKNFCPTSNAVHV